MSPRRKLSPIEQLHADWLGALLPPSGVAEGLVVSIPVLIEADAYVRLPSSAQESLRALAPDEALTRDGLLGLLTGVLGWPQDRLLQGEAVEPFAVAVPDLGVVLRPDLALVDRAGRPLVLVSWSDAPLDALAEPARWGMTWQSRFERLLTEGQTSDGGGCPVGLHASPTALRLTYAPRGEAPGRLTWPVSALCAWDGRVLLDAFHMLLGHGRLFVAKKGAALGQGQRLHDLLHQSRRRQEQVTVALAGQVEDALDLLLAGFDVANQRERGGLLRQFGEGSADPLRHALVTFMLRVIFLLYCEDAGVLPTDNPLYLQSYSIVGLLDALERDRVLAPEAMRHRYGGWARLCALFRVVHQGVTHDALTLPPRQGELFHPDQTPLLEGRVSAHAPPAPPPPIDDGVVLDVLERLVYLENQRLSYRNLDVEQLGSVYEALMGLEVRRCASLTLPLRGGAWLSVGDALDSDRPIPVVAAATGQKEAELTRRAPGLAGLVWTGDRAADEASLRGALTPLLDPNREARAPGRHVLVGGAERRRTGSHYTPSSLTTSVVERTLAPLLGPAPSAERVLNLKVCDPAMGSGAFLAECCRYLARRLLDAWAREGVLATGADGGDPLLEARRQVVERCLYGVDKNPFAVQLARLSLWLVTLSKDRPFTFVDHALREGDAVIGLDADQIAGFSLSGGSQNPLIQHGIRRSVKDAIRDRAGILEPSPLFDAHGVYQWKKQHLTRALDEVALARERGDLRIALAWAGDKGKAAKQREARLVAMADNRFVSDGERALEPDAEALLAGLVEAGLKPFHWPLEYPEVFGRPNPGFDAVVGNPPFLGGKTIRTSLTEAYPRVLALLRPHSNGNADLCAHFFLRAAEVLRSGGTFGLVATNSIKQGETRAAGLQHLVNHGVTLYDATVDMEWPVAQGAAVVVDVVYGCKGSSPTGRELNSSLEEAEELVDPVVLVENAERAFVGCFVLGKGFLLTPEEAHVLLNANPKNADIVKPYIGGEELNKNVPSLDGMVLHDRYVISFFDRSLEEAARWPELLAIVEERVRPERTRTKPDGTFQLRNPLPQRWWQFADKRPALYTALRPLKRCLVSSMVSKHHLFAFQPTDRVFAQTTNVFAFDDYCSFAVLQSRVHEAWARHAGLGSTMKTDARYTPSTCFETFPFPRPSEAQRLAVAQAGEALDTARAACMRRLGEGMTKVWNRLYDPDEHDPDIVALRALREAMDRAVLDAYGWGALSPEDTPAIVARLRALNTRRAAEERRRR